MDSEIEDGWGEEDDFDLDVEDANDEVKADILGDAVDQEGDAEEVDDQWSFDDDEIIIEEEDDRRVLLSEDDNHHHHPPDPSTGLRPPPPPPPPRSLNPKKTDSPLLSSLKSYVTSLTPPTPLLPSVNAILASEHSTLENAVELRSYYASRPGLRDYTLDTELPRMDYVLHVPGGTTLTDKGQIQRFLSNRKSEEAEEVLLRASNQSLLADVMVAITGEDLLIRPQFMSSGVADKCEFVLDLNRMCVEVRCRLVVSIPSGGTGGRLELANVEVRVYFSPGGEDEAAATVQYDVISMDPLLSSNPDDDKLRAAAEALGRDLDMMNPVQHMEEEEHDAQRDHFLADLGLATYYFQAKQVGFQSALRQIDDVTRVSRKLEFLGRVMPTLPTAEALRASEEEVEAAREREIESVTHQPPAEAKQQRGAGAASGLFDRLSSQRGPSGGTGGTSFPRPPPEQPSDRGGGGGVAVQGRGGAGALFDRLSDGGAKGKEPSPSFPRPPHGGVESRGRQVPPPPRPPPPTTSASRRQQPPPPPRPRAPHAPPPPDAAAATTMPEPSGPTARPPSIVGGWLSRLAQNAAKPDDEDGGGAAAPVRGERAAPPPQLYRREDGGGGGVERGQPDASFGRTGTGRSPPPPPLEDSGVPRLYLTEEEGTAQQDRHADIGAKTGVEGGVTLDDGGGGWSDDDDLELDDEQDTPQETKNAGGNNWYEHGQKPSSHPDAVGNSTDQHRGDGGGEVGGVVRNFQTATKEQVTVVPPPPPTARRAPPTAASLGAVSMSSVAAATQHPPPKKGDDKNVKNNEFGIIETRKRWINPRGRDRFIRVG